MPTLSESRSDSTGTVTVAVLFEVTESLGGVGGTTVNVALADPTAAGAVA